MIARRWLPSALVIVAGCLLLLGIASCHGQTVRHPDILNHPGKFNFKRPSCNPADLGQGVAGGPVLLRYLGVGGVFIQWRQNALLTAPFFSNPSEFQAFFGKVHWDHSLIRRGMRGTPDTLVRAVLAGHAHYDHLADLPPIVAGWANGADLLVNRSGKHMLERCPQLAQSRLRVLEDLVDDWVVWQDDRGLPLFRAMPIVSGHARQHRLVNFAKGEVEEPWDCLEGRKVRAMRHGQTFSFLIDLLHPDGRIAFRMFYQDAASDAPEGFPSAELIAEHPVDLAILCMPAHWLAEDYPGGVLRHTGARHVMALHYEDFFRSGRPLRFVPTLTNDKANRFLREVTEALEGREGDGRRPGVGLCGPQTDDWSMPLPGEWMGFRPAG